MPMVQTIKLVVAVAGLSAFFLGVRLESAALRWAGVGLVFAALLLRFVRPRR